MKNLNNTFLKYFVFLMLLLFICGTDSFAQPRFPQPEFESGYVTPDTQVVMPKGIWFDYMDIAVLLILLTAATLFVLKYRWRTGVVIVSVLSIAYFGFYRVGCVCSVGSVQNVALALFQKSYIIPVSVIAFFTIPLVFTLFFGRTFCSGVCFFGAIQELLIIKPLTIPVKYERLLSGIPYLYLVFGVLFAATGSDFIICRFDPFIGMFRFDGTAPVLIFGLILLLLSTVIARPYCRFLCPYGVLLGWFSLVSKKGVSITPSKCIQCKLCQNSCPVNAIRVPDLLQKPEVDGVRKLGWSLILFPVLIMAGGFAFSQLYKPLSTVHPTVNLAEEIHWEIKNNSKTNSENSKAFHSMGVPVEQLFSDASAIQSKFYTGLWWAGMFSGLFLAIAFIKLSVIRTPKIYEPDKFKCISCTRCYKFCPVDKVPETVLSGSA